MTPDQIRQIVREELAGFIKSDRYTFEKTLQLMDGRNLQLGRTTGTKVGTGTDQKLGFFNTTPVVQQASSSTAAGIKAVLQAYGLMANP